MKTYRNLYDTITDFEHLCDAYRKARKGHMRTADHLRFAENLGDNLLEIQERLRTQSWRTGPYRHFQVYEPKVRQIAALPFADRVVQHALVSVIEPIWEARFVHDSCACRVGRGVHFGLHRTQRMIQDCIRRHGHAFVLKADVRRYFYSVDHAILKRILDRRVACERTRWLVHEIIDSTPDGVGIPIGNLTSQLFANAYLDRLDQHVKQDLRERRFCRYMDDFVIIHPDKNHLHELRRHLEEWLWSTLRLELNEKTQVRPVDDTPSHRIDFLGYRIGPTRRSVRKRTLKRMRRGLKAAERGKLHADVEQFRASYLGILGHEHPLRPEVIAAQKERA